MRGEPTAPRVRRIITSLATAAGLLIGLTLVAPPAARADTPGRLLGASCDIASSTLYDVPVGGGAVSTIGPITVADHVPCVLGLAYDSGTLYGIDQEWPDGFAGNLLLDIPLTAGATDIIGNVDLAKDGWACGLGLTAAGGQLWTFANPAGDLYTVDPATGTPTFVGATGLSYPCSLAYVPSTGLLYTVDLNGDLYSIDPATAEATYVGSTGINKACSIVYDSDNDTVYAGEDNPNAHLYQLDITTGATTDLGATGATGLCGMTYIPAVVEPTTTTTEATTTTTQATTTTSQAVAAVATTPRFTG